MTELTDIAQLAALAGAHPDEVMRVDRMSRITHHVAEGRRWPTCEPGPLDWQKAHPDWDKVDCIACLRRRS